MPWRATVLDTEKLSPDIEEIRKSSIYLYTATVPIGLYLELPPIYRLFMLNTFSSCFYFVILSFDGTIKKKRHKTIVLLMLIHNIIVFVVCLFFLGIFDRRFLCTTYFFHTIFTFFTLFSSCFLCFSKTLTYKTITWFKFFCKIKCIIDKCKTR